MQGMLQYTVATCLLLAGIGLASTGCGKQPEPPPVAAEWPSDLPGREPTHVTRTIPFEVVDHRGEPLAGALILPRRGESATTGSDGNAECKFEVPDDAPHYASCTVWLRGYEIGHAGPLPEGVQRIILQPDHPQSVQVVDSAKKRPLAGVRIEVCALRDPPVRDAALVDVALLPLPDAGVTTDSEGRALLPAAESLWLLVEMEGRLPQRVSVHRQRATDAIEEPIELRADAPARVRVTDESGAPIVGARIGVGMDSPAVWTTGADGWAVIGADYEYGFDEFRVDAGAWRLMRRLKGEQSLKPPHTLTISVASGVLEGRLAPPAGFLAEEFEVATAALIGDSFWNRFPQEQHCGWHPVAADGVFRISSGWRGQRTGVVVRHVAVGTLLLWQELVTGKPVSIALPPLARTQVVLRGFEGGYLEPMTLVVTRSDGSADESAAPKVALATYFEPLRLATEEALLVLPFGEAEFKLNDSFIGDRLTLGSRTLAQSSQRVEFDFRERRAVSGRITADGVPVPQCAIRIGGELEGAIKVHAGRYRGLTDSDGLWYVPNLPAGRLPVRVAPLDPWMVTSGIPRAYINETDRRMDVDLPVASITFTAGQSQAFTSRRVAVKRYALPEEGGKLMDSLSADVDLAGLADGPLVRRTTPCELRLGALEPFGLVQPERIEVRAGETLSVDVTTRWGGGLMLHTRGSPAEIRLVSPDGKEVGAESRAPHQWDRGRIQYGDDQVPYAVLEPGLWTVTMRGPLTEVTLGGYPDCETTETVSGSDDSFWSGKVQIAALKRTDLTIEVNSKGELIAVVGDPR